MMPHALSLRALMHGVRCVLAACLARDHCRYAVNAVLADCETAERRRAARGYTYPEANPRQWQAGGRPMGPSPSTRSLGRGGEPCSHRLPSVWFAFVGPRSDVEVVLLSLRQVTECAAALAQVHASVVVRGELRRHHAYG